MFKSLLLSTVVLLAFSVTAGSWSNDTINHLNGKGEREGWWILSADNKPVKPGSVLKSKEGRYVNGRKNGVWIAYFEDGSTPRLIGEYADNRPSGSYFRFDRAGELQQASSVPKHISAQQSVQASNSIFSCKMLFINRDVVAGQVFFSPRVFKKNRALNFWVESSMEFTESESSLVDFTWLNANYSRILMAYLQIRTPKKMRVEEPPVVHMAATKKLSERQQNARNQNYYYPPTIREPRVGKGMVFRPNGLNKLYTEDSEIWMDGLFVNGQLSLGKVFIYDHDGILLKVRVYKNGIYDSDGVL